MPADGAVGITSDEVRRIAALARLQIDDDEAEMLARDLERIVAYIDLLAEVDLPDDAESLTYFDQDVHREDRTGECLGAEAALRNAPETDSVYFVVPQIVDKDDS